MDLCEFIFRDLHVILRYTCNYYIGNHRIRFIYFFLLELSLQPRHTRIKCKEMKRKEEEEKICNQVASVLEISIVCFGAVFDDQNNYGWWFHVWKKLNFRQSRNFEWRQQLLEHIVEWERQKGTKNRRKNSDDNSASFFFPCYDFPTNCIVIIFRL